MVSFSQRRDVPTETGTKRTMTGVFRSRPDNDLPILFVDFGENGKRDSETIGITETNAEAVRVGDKG